MDEATVAGLREALTEVHGQEREYRAAALAALRTRYDDVQKKKDILLNRHLAGVVPDEEYKRKYATLKEEQVVIETAVRTLEVAQERFYEEAELLLQLAGLLREVFEKGSDERRLAVIKVVASNATLRDRNARLNLFPPFEVLAKARGHTRWLNSMIHDSLVDAGLLGAYGLDLKAKFREEAAEARRNLEELAEEPRGLGRVHWVFNYTSTIIDFGLAYGDVDPETDECVRWFQNRYPSVAAEARNLVEHVRAMGYETPAQAVTLLRAIVEKYEISGRVFVFYGPSDEEVAVHES